MGKVKRLWFVLLAALIGLCALLFAGTLAACTPDRNQDDTDVNRPGDETDKDPDDEKDPEVPDPVYDGIFAAQDGQYVLTGDYTLGEEDLDATDAADDTIVLTDYCTFNLGGHTLDLGGLRLEIASEQAGGTVTFKNGTIKNGSLEVAVPNGDISFESANIASDVVYELEAASETIRFSNASVSGKCTIRSDTRVQVEYSSVSDITLAGNGSLVAGQRAELGSVTVGESASGAKVTVTPDASVSSVQLKAAADVSVSGSVSAVTVSEAVKDDEGALTISVAEDASVDMLELNASAQVNVAGSVASVTVSEAVQQDAADLTIDVKETAQVTKIELNAAAQVNVAGSVQAVTVGEAAKSDTADLTIDVKETASVSKLDLNAPAAVDVSGTVSNVNVKENASGATVNLSETASVATIAVTAEEIKVDSAAQTQPSIVVTDKVTISSDTGVTATETVTEEEMEENYMTHTHLYVPVSRTEATCTEAGKVVERCECGDEHEKVIPALGHKTVYTVVKEPTETESGEGVYTCIRCGTVTERVTIPRLGSITITGINELFSLIPDGTYTLTQDDADKLYLDPGAEQGRADVEEFEAVIEVYDGEVNGTVTGSVRVLSADWEGCITENLVVFKAVIDQNVLYFHGDNRYESDDSSSEGSVDTRFTISALIKGLALYLVGVDPDAVYNDYAAIIEGVLGAGEDEDIGALVKDAFFAMIEKAFDSKSEANGVTTYTFRAEKLVDSLTELGEKTPAQLIDALIGEGTYADLKAFADGLADMQVKEVADKLFTIAENAGISEDQLFLAAEKVLASLMQMSVDIDELFAQYSDYTVAEAMAEYMLLSQGGGDVPDAPNEPSVEPYALPADSQVTPEMVEQVKAMLAEQITNYAQLFTSPVSGLIGMIIPSEGEPVSFEQILSMVEGYAAGATLSFSLNGEDVLTALSVSYGMPVDESGTLHTLVTLTWREGSKVPDIQVDIPEQGEGSLKENADGSVTLSADVCGIGVTLTAKESSAGTSIEASVVRGEEDLGSLSVAVVPAQNGGKLTIAGDFRYDLFGGSAQNPDAGVPGGSEEEPEEEPEEARAAFGGTLSYASGSGTADSEAWAEYEAFSEVFYHADLVLSRSYGGWSSSVISLQYVSDAEGEYYLAVMREYMSMDAELISRDPDVYQGTVVWREYTVRVGCLNGLPEVIASSSDDCGDWLYLSMVVGGVAEVSMVEAVGVFTIDESGDRIFSSMQSEERTELGTKVFDPFTSTMSGYVYYDPVTGEAAYRSQHDLQYTGVLHEGSLTCEDGIFVTETCKNCDHTATYTRSSHLYEQEETVYETQCGDVVIRDEVCSVCGDKQHYVNYYGNHEFSIQSKEILTSERFAGEIAALEQEGYPAEEAEEKVRENYACIEDLAGHDFPTANFASGDAQERHCAVCGLNVTCYTYYTGTGDAADCTYHTAYVFDYRGNDYFEGFGATDHFARHSHRYEGSEVMPQMSVSEAVSEFEAASGISLGFTPDSVYVYDSECVMCGDQDTRDYHFSSDEGSSADATIDYTNGTAVSWSLYETLYGDHIGARLSDYEAYLNGFAYEDGRAEYRANGTIGNGTGCTEYEYYYVTLYAADGMDGRDEFRLYVTLNDLNSASGYGTLRTEHYVYSECTVYETEYGYENGGWVQSGTQTSERHDMTYEEVHAGHCTEDGRLTVEQCKVCGKTEEPSMQLEYSHSYRYVGAEGTNVAEIAKDCSVNGLTGMSANYSYRERCEYCGDLSGLTLILTDDWTLTQDEYIRATDLTIDLNGYTIDLNGYSLLVYGYRDQYEMRGSVTFTDSAYDTSAEEGGAQSGAIVNSGASGVFAVFVNGGDILMGTVSVTAEAYMSDGDNLYTIYDSLLENGYDVSIAQAQSPMFSYSLMEYGDMKFYAIDGIDAPQAAGGYLESYVAAESGELDMQFFVVSVKMSAGEQFMFDVQTNEGITVYVTSENGSNSAKASYNGSGSGTVTISSDLQPSYDEDGTVHYPEVWVTYVIGVSNCYEMGLDHGDAMFTNFRVE